MSNFQKGKRFVLDTINENIAFVNINGSHPDNFGDCVTLEHIQGAASGAWIIKKDKREKCGYAAAIYKTKIEEFFKIKKVISIDEVEKYSNILEEKIKYPSHREIEFIAAGCESVKEVKEKLGNQMGDLFNILGINCSKEELEQKFTRWKRGRCYFILEPCLDQKWDQWKGGIPYKDDKHFRFYGGSSRVYFGRKNV